MEEEIYEKYASKIYKYIYALCQNNEIAEEILQDTFYNALKNIKKFNGNSSIYTWLCTIARNNWKNYLKRKSKIQFVSLEDNDISTVQDIENIENKQELYRFYEAMHKLDSITKEILLIRLHTNLNFKEIGNLFGKTEQWARNRFYRGKLKVKEEISNEQQKL